LAPIWGISTSRISTPGLASGFITASMVLGINAAFWISSVRDESSQF
jgi:hypothetical protein